MSKVLLTVSENVRVTYVDDLNFGVEQYGANPKKPAWSLVAYVGLARNLPEIVSRYVENAEAFNRGPLGETLKHLKCEKLEEME